MQEEKTFYIMRIPSPTISLGPAIWAGMFALVRCWLHTLCWAAVNQQQSEQGRVRWPGWLTAPGLGTALAGAGAAPGAARSVHQLLCQWLSTYTHIQNGSVSSPVDFDHFNHCLLFSPLYLSAFAFQGKVLQYYNIQQYFFYFFFQVQQTRCCFIHLIRLNQLPVISCLDPHVSSFKWSCF